MASCSWHTSTRWSSCVPRATFGPATGWSIFHEPCCWCTIARLFINNRRIFVDVRRYFALTTALIFHFISSRHPLCSRRAPPTSFPVWVRQQSFQAVCSTVAPSWGSQPFSIALGLKWTDANNCRGQPSKHSFWTDSIIIFNWTCYHSHQLAVSLNHK